MESRNADGELRRTVNFALMGQDGQPHGLNSDYPDKIRANLLKLSKDTCIDFREIQPRQESQFEDQGIIRVFSSSGCFSALGRVTTNWLSARVLIIFSALNPGAAGCYQMVTNSLKIEIKFPQYFIPLLNSF